MTFLSKIVMRGLRVYWRATRSIALAVEACVIDAEYRIALVKADAKNGWRLPRTRVRKGEALDDALRRFLMEDYRIRIVSRPDLFWMFGESGRARVLEMRSIAMILLALPFGDHLLDLGDGLSRIEAFRAGPGAIEDGMASIEPERVFQLVETVPGRFVAAIDDQALGLQQYRRSQIAIVVPPPAWAAAGATEAQDAFPTAIQPCPLNDRQRPFAVGRRRRVSLQPWLDDVVLSEQMTPICHQILDHRLVPALWRSMFWSRSQQRGSRSHAPLARGHVLVLSLASVAWRATLGPFALLCPRNQA